MARGPDEREAVIAVLSEFFHETPTGWFHDRCEEELEVYRKSKSQASAAGKASAAARAERRAQAMGNETSTTVERPLNDRTTDSQRAVNDTPTNQEPITNNHKPVTKEKKPSPVGDDLFPGVDPQVVDDFKALRKQKRAPVTPTAMAKIVAEAGKAGITLEAALRICCSRGWQGFEADWLSRRTTDVRALPQPDKFQVAGLDHTSTNEAMAASMKRHNIVVPDGDIEF